jgi:hypothetical protein
MNHEPLIVKRTSAGGCYGTAYVLAVVSLSWREWKRTSRSLPGPGLWSRAIKILYKRSERPHEIVLVTTESGQREYRCVWVDMERDRGELQIAFSQDVSMSEVPPGCTIQFLRREWAEPGFGRVQPEKQSPDVRGRGGCDATMLAWDRNGTYEIDKRTLTIKPLARCGSQSPAARDQPRG